MDLSTRDGRRQQGQLIHKAVERAGLSIEELANRIGCSRALVYQYLSGTTLAQPDRLQQIAAEVSVPLAYFYTEQDDDERAGRRKSRQSQGDERFRARVEQLEELARAQEAPPDWEGLASTCERIVSLAAPLDESGVEARALLRMGKARCHTGEFARAAASLQRAAALFARLEDKPAEADARQALGHALLAVGKTMDARAQFEWLAASGLWQARWTGTVSLAGMLEETGDYRGAMEKCDEAASILEESTEPVEVARGMLYVNANRVNVYLACGDFAGAQALAEKCRDEAEALGVADQNIEARLNIGVCATNRGKWALALHTLSSALQMARLVGDRSRESLARATLATLLAALCDCDPCIREAKDALAAALAQGDHRVELFAQLALADAYFALDRESEARYHANQALAVANSLRLAQYDAAARLRIARLALHANDIPEADSQTEIALAAARRLGARHLEAEALVLSARGRLQAGDYKPAEHLASSASMLARTIDAAPLEWEAESILAFAAIGHEPADRETAEGSAARAIALIEAVRGELRDAGIQDTMLEDRDRQAVYILRARLIAESGRPEDARRFAEEVGWPPLAANIDPAARPTRAIRRDSRRS